MMSSRELKKEAKESLKGNKAKAGGTYLIYLLVTIGITFVTAFLQGIGSLISSIITAGLLYGCITVLMRIKRKQDVSAAACVGEGFEKCLKIFCCNLWVGLELLLWSILFIISIVVTSLGAEATPIFSIIGLVLMVFTLIKLIEKSLRFSLVNYLVYDNQELSARDVVKKSEEIMKQNKNVGRIFDLNLSFIGWFILYYIGIGFTITLMTSYSSTQVLGLIGYIVILFSFVFFLAPYIQMANVCFYEEAIGNMNKNEESTEEVENPIMQ